MELDVLHSVIKTILCRLQCSVTIGMFVLMNLALFCMILRPCCDREACFVFILRDCNQVTHEIARFAFNSWASGSWHSLFPNWSLNFVSVSFSNASYLSRF